MIKLQKRDEPNNTKLISSENEIMLLHFKSKGVEGTIVIQWIDFAPSFHSAALIF